MANYQNNMRYSRMGNMYSQYRQNNNMLGRDTCGCTFEAKDEQQCENQCKRENREGQQCENCCERESRDERRYKHSCEEYCNDSLSELPLGMAYVPWQKWRNIYETCKGFQRGTIFGELDKLFLGRGGCNR